MDCVVFSDGTDSLTKKKLEMVQRRAARFVKSIGILSKRRKDARLILSFFYKIKQLAASSLPHEHILTEAYEGIKKVLGRKTTTYFGIL